MCSSVFLLVDFTSHEFSWSIAQLNPDHSLSRVVLKNLYTIYFFTNFTWYHLNRRKIIQWNVYWKYFNDLFDMSRMSDRRSDQVM